MSAPIDQQSKNLGHLAVFLISLGVIGAALLFATLDSGSDSTDRIVQKEDIDTEDKRGTELYPEDSLVAGPLMIKGQFKPGEKIGQVKVFNTAGRKIPVELSYKRLTATKSRPSKEIYFSQKKIMVPANSQITVDAFLRRKIADDTDLVGNISVRGLAPQEATSSQPGEIKINSFLNILIPVAIKMPGSARPEVKISKTALSTDRLGLIPVADVVNNGGLALDFSGRFLLRGPGGLRTMPVEGEQFIPGQQRTAISGKTAWSRLRPGDYRLQLILRSGEKIWQASYPVEVGPSMTVSDEQEKATLSVAADLSEIEEQNIRSQFSIQNQARENLELKVKTTIESKALISLKELKQRARTPEQALRVIAEQQKENQVLFQEMINIRELAPGKSASGTVLALNLPLSAGQRYFLRTDLFSGREKLATKSQYLGTFANLDFRSEGSMEKGNPLFLLLALLLPALLLPVFIILLRKSDAGLDGANKSGKADKSDKDSKAVKGGKADKDSKAVKGGKGSKDNKTSEAAKSSTESKNSQAGESAKGVKGSKDSKTSEAAKGGKDSKLGRGSTK